MENLWQCKACGFYQEGGDACQSCGAPRPAESLPPTKTPAKPKPAVKKTSMKGKGCALLFMYLFVVVGVVVLVWGIVETQNYLALKNEGVTTVGEWVSRRRSTDSDGNDTYFVTYAFTALDRQYVHEQSVSAERYNRYEKGGRVTVLYLPYNPDVAKIEGTNTIPWPLFVFSAVWLSFSFFFIWLIRRQ